MHITAERIAVTGAHGPILRPTSLAVARGELLLASGEANSGRTALALALAGRLRPSDGRVTVDGSPDPATLRASVSVVDSAGITAPEGSVPLRDVVAEGLALSGHRASRRAVRSWLSQHDAIEHATSRFEQLDATTRTRLLVDLATTAKGVRVLVLDCPDRHGGPPNDWYRLARRQATAHERAVVVLCAPTTPEALGVSAARIGADNRPEAAAGSNDPGERREVSDQDAPEPDDPAARAATGPPSANQPTKDES